MTNLRKLHALFTYYRICGFNTLLTPHDIIDTLNSGTMFGKKQPEEYIDPYALLELYKNDVISKEEIRKELGFDT